MQRFHLAFIFAILALICSVNSTPVARPPNHPANNVYPHRNGSLVNGTALDMPDGELISRKLPPPPFSHKKQQPHLIYWDVEDGHHKCDAKKKFKNSWYMKEDKCKTFKSPINGMVQFSELGYKNCSIVFYSEVYCKLEMQRLTPEEDCGPKEPEGGCKKCKFVKNAVSAMTKCDRYVEPEKEDDERAFKEADKSVSRETEIQDFGGPDTAATDEQQAAGDRIAADQIAAHNELHRLEADANTALGGDPSDGSKPSEEADTLDWPEWKGSNDTTTPQNDTKPERPANSNADDTLDSANSILVERTFPPEPKKRTPVVKLHHFKTDESVRDCTGPMKGPQGYDLKAGKCKTFGKPLNGIMKMTLPKRDNGFKMKGTQQCTVKFFPFEGCPEGPVIATLGPEDNCKHRTIFDRLEDCEKCDFVKGALSARVECDD